MYDAVNVSAIPADATMVAGYIDGHYRTFPTLEQRFPNAIKVPIAVFPSTNGGTVLDCETGDATPAQCPGWVKMRRAAGVDPTVYCMISQWSAVRQAFQSAGVAEPHYWIAHYDNVAQLIPGAVAKQYGGSNGYDLSVVEDYWPGVDMFTPEQEQQILKAMDLVQEIHDAIYKGHPEFAQPGMEGTTFQTYQKVVQGK